MLQDRFSALASLHIESDVARKIDINKLIELIDEFAQSGAFNSFKWTTTLHARINYLCCSEHDLLGSVAT